MKKQLLLMCVIGALSACSTDGIPRKQTFFSDACQAEVIGYTRTKVRYGDSYLEVRPVSNVWANTEFQVELRPRDATRIRSLEVRGDEADEDAGWIRGTGEGQEDDPSGTIIIVGCVPNAEPGKEYKFDVLVDGVGVLDPRARIISR